MSVEVMDWVWQHSRSKNAQRLVLLAIADCCHRPDGTGAWPSAAELISKTNLSARAVQEATRGLEALGELKVEIGAGPRGCNRYTVVMAWGSSTPADSAPPQDLRPAGSAPPLSGEFPQVNGQDPAESAPPANPADSAAPPAESAPGTVSKTKNPKTLSSSATPPKAPRKPEPRRDDVERICTHLADRIEANGCKRPNITDTWRREARLLLDEKRPVEVTVERVIRAIDWCQSDEFWRGVVLSMPKLRAKYEQLRLAASRSGTGRASGGYKPWRNYESETAYDAWMPHA